MPVNRVHTNKTSDWIASKIAMFNITMQRNYVNLILIKLLHVYHTYQSLACEYGKSIRGVSGLALEESKMHTFS